MIPIIGVIMVFSYAFFYLQKDIDFISHELRGLTVIANIQKTVFNIQKIRGLACIEKPDQNSLDTIEFLNKEIAQNLNSLQQSLVPIQNDTSLKKDFFAFIGSVQKRSLANSDFKSLSQIIQTFMTFSNQIAYHCKLVLDPELTSFILINNIVYLLPEIIEYNGQIRAMATSTIQNRLASEQKEHIIIQLNKIKERQDKFDYNMNLLYKASFNGKAKKFHEQMKKAEKNIIAFVEKNLLQHKANRFDPNEMFMLITDNINFIINLYDANLENLRQSLEKRLAHTKRLSFYNMLAGVLFILFIFYINRFFYCKNREFIDKIEKLTITDSMSSLYNRRHFDEVFETNLRIQQRTGQSLILIILDIDFFKQYNDTYGHQAGDEVIKKVAANLKDSLKRASDMAFRLGGEEFGILCLDMNADEALLFAESIREKIQNEKIEHKTSSVSDYLTVSMGLLVIESNTIRDTSQAYKYADKALYKAKESGRNQVVVYDFTPL